MLTVPEAGKVLNISRSAIWKLVWSGELPSYRLAERTVRIDRRDLDTFIAERRSA